MAGLIPFTLISAGALLSFLRGTERSAALYTRASVPVADNLTVDLGGRVDWWRSEPTDATLPDKSVTFFSPRASVALRQGTSIVAPPARVSSSRAGSSTLRSATPGYQPSTSTTTSLMRRSVVCSRPFARLTTSALAEMYGFAPSSTFLSPCDGTPSTTTSASLHAAPSDAVTSSAPGSSNPGR